MSGYSPAMIEQAISMAFTIAHHTLVTRADPAPPAKWSAWHPTGSETAQIKQIADQVARRYRVETGQQLVAAVPSEPRATGATGEVPLSTIAIRPDGEATATSVFLKRSDVKDVLKSPLAETISPKAPSIGKMPQRERALVNKITEPRLYNYEYQQAQDGSVVLIYNPIVLGA